MEERKLTWRLEEKDSFKKEEQTVSKRSIIHLRENGEKELTSVKGNVR